MNVLGSLSKHQRRLISAQLVKQGLSSTVKVSNTYENDKKEFEKNLNRIACSYYNFKLSHNGLISYKQFENCNRTIKNKSLMNLLNYNPFNDENQTSSKPFDPALGFLPSERELKRGLSEKQSKECKKMCNKLIYYSVNRKFKSKSSGSYNFKIAFLTLTAPESTENYQFLKAFELFCDYLRRTANCVFVWKKELGSKSGKLHVHLLINNFIPYYIVDWKWKRLLISQGVIWPKNDKGKDTSSHYRIELPRNAKSAGGYISKYMSKIDYVSDNIGYLWGKSKVLSDCKENVLIEGEVDNDEIYNIYSKYKTIGTEYVKICLVDLLKINKIAPELYNIFKAQFYDFQSRISLPQRFQSV